MKGKKESEGHSPRKCLNWAQTPEFTDSSTQENEKWNSPLRPVWFQSYTLLTLKTHSPLYLQYHDIKV